MEVQSVNRLLSGPSLDRFFGFFGESLSHLIEWIGSENVNLCCRPGTHIQQVSVRIFEHHLTCNHQLTKNKNICL